MNKTVKIALDYLAGSVLDGTVSLSMESTKELARLSRNVHLRWVLLLEKVIVRCPVCMSKMKSDCGRFRCYICDEDFMLASKALGSICKSCVAFKDGSCKGTMGEDLENPILVSRKTGKVIPGWTIGNGRV